MVRKLHWLSLIAALFSGLGGNFAIAATKQCTRQMAIAAEGSAAENHDWRALYFSYRKYAACDDGAIWEGYSDDVARLLTQKWRDVGKFAPLKTDRGFVKFVARHVDELMSRETAKEIETKARAECPAGMKSFCKAVAKAAATKPQ